MLRQVSSRNHRAKGGFKAKNALQICMLVVVCVWLLYQMKRSHDRRKVSEERFGADEARSQIASFGRKDLLPRTVEADSVSDTRAKQDLERDVKHDEHPGQSHEAREKSFKADDAASEVVHSNSQHERSFTADDASSAVDHFVPVREPESGIGLFDSSKGTHSSVVREDNSPVPVVKVTTSTTGEADDGVDDQTELETADRIFHETKPQTHSANGSDDRIELELGSTYSSTNQTDVQKNHTAVSADRTETPKNQTTMDVLPLRHPTNSHPLQDQLPWTKKSETENAVIVDNEPHQTAQSEEPEGSSLQGGNQQVLPREPRDSNPHGIASVEQRDGRHDPTSARKIQHKVDVE
ncbi:hypothetical protein MUK42_31121 [Musa troglodytarum]|uniref:Uncharacterized protein n=1 Tax=Musa troglodytarum TaxID=320322 RepID=A0A9E7FMI7_9LILI|nr:hypothetical protein MUK42_31121 [Musa troglodytarum]